MTGAEIISKFETYVDDLTELSSSEELDLMNKVYFRMCDKLTEVLKKTATGTMASTTTITLPADFSYPLPTRQYTSNALGQDYDAAPTFVRINGSKQLQLVNWSERRQYENSDGYAYIDLASNVIRTTYAQDAGATYDFDYKANPAALTLVTSPIFPFVYHPGIYHGMAAEDSMIQLMDKSKSYAVDHQAYFNSYAQDLALWNARMQQY